MSAANVDIFDNKFLSINQNLLDGSRATKPGTVVTNSSLPRTKSRNKHSNKDCFLQHANIEEGKPRGKGKKRGKKKGKH